MRSFIVSVLENNPAIKNPILTILSVPCEKCSRLAQRLRSLLKINATNILWLYSRHFQNCVPVLLALIVGALAP
jgi:hypothetical protein